MEIVAQPEWNEIAKRLIEHKGTAILLGATDSGKSTLARYLVKELTSMGVKVTLVDSDIGQSLLGLPGTISMKTFDSEASGDNRDLMAEKMLFVGTFNPAYRISLMIEGTKRMVNLAKMQSDIVLVDTTGLVSGEVGKALKTAKIEAIKPKHIIALQRQNELRPILSVVKDANILL
jgi:polynucleotide 5'-hydroxyl-kinase GRC3/NOL9